MKKLKKSDIVSLAGVAAYSVLAVWNTVSYTVIGRPEAILANAAVSAVFLLFSLFVLFGRLPFLWLAAGGAGVVLSCCTGITGFITNVVYPVQTAVAFACGVVGFAFQFKERANPRRPAYIWLLTLIITVAALGGYWGGSVSAAKRRTGEPRREIWGVPDKYLKTPCPEPGSIETLEYETRAYATDKRAVVKRANIYLPYGYDSAGEYEILYLMHGTGDDEDYWLKTHADVKTMIDNLVYHGDIQPIIIVTPTWYVGDDCADSLDELTYSFKDELRCDLMPAVESKYSTFAKAATSEEFIKSRGHRAFAGLSRGSVTAWHSAFNGSLDYFSKFGCFSGCRTADEEFESGIRSDKFKDYSIDYLYNSSGSFDFLLKEHVKSYKRLLKSEPRLEEGRNCSFDVFPASYHSINSWRIALYNCLQLFY